LTLKARISVERRLEFNSSNARFGPELYRSFLPVSGSDPAPARIEDDPMRIEPTTVFAIVHLGVAVILGSAGAHAQTIPTIALKSGESTEINVL
jgi:hypothetical protein